MFSDYLEHVVNIVFNAGQYKKLKGYFNVITVRKTFEWIVSRISLPPAMVHPPVMGLENR